MDMADIHSRTGGGAAQGRATFMHMFPRDLEDAEAREDRTTANRHRPCGPTVGTAAQSEE